MEHYYQEHFEEMLDIFCVAADGGAFSVRMDEDFTLLYGSERYYEIHGYTRDNMRQKLQNKCVRYIYPDDLERVRAYCRDCVEQKKDRSQWEMRIVTGEGNLKYVKCAGAVVERDGEIVMHGFIMDLTEQKELKEENRLSRDTIKIAVEQANMTFWIFDIPGRRILQEEYVGKVFGNELVTENIPDRLYGTGAIYPDDENMVKAMFADIFAGKPRAQCVARWRNVETGEYWWAKILYTTIFNDAGEPVKAVGSAIDFTEQMQLQKKHESQMSYNNIVEDSMMGSFRLNLTQNWCGEGRSVFPYILHLQEDGTADGLFSLIYADIPDHEQREQFAAQFNRANLLEQFAEGMIHSNMEIRRKTDVNRCEWVDTHINLTQNPTTGDVEALIYTFNIHHTKMMQLMMAHTVECDYDYIALLDINDESHIDVINEKSMAVRPPIELSKYSEVVLSFVHQQVVPEQREEVIRAKSVSNLVKQLALSDSYTMTYKAIQKDGSIGYKRTRYSYLDKEAGQIVFSVTDITKEMETEQKKNELLNAALVAAEQASSAKTDFLSRMSHEIRTPMNAIIGMTAIAVQSMGDDAQVEDCLSKIGISSRFLLTLINDILDMSRIESGKVLLKCEKIPFAELISSINSICYNQAKAKDIDYECTVDSNVEDSYMGDAMKLQQILLNILSNAIKFTDASGKVSLDIRQLKKTENNATLRFTVNDTGCGISEEFIPKLFDTFSQEHFGATTMYGGTGLGLAICKNLVELMDGKIEVRSILGVGTEFRVTVTLGMTEEAKAGYTKKLSCSFEKLNALVVDDDVTVCQYAMMTLKEIGIRAEWVDSGKKAIDQVREKWDRHHYYDLILLDWKMPDMDGIEAAKEIRKIVGPDVTIIIMTAYDWAAIEHEAKLAGVNLLISKPLFKSTLISAFHKALGEKAKETVAAEPEDYDFAGYRILLVEDHPLNVEVARKLLERKGFTVDCAENGLRAIEVVTLAPDYYYDAILMDIRMPVMDGLQATQGIRNLHKKSAKMVPIIAMTANAFDDDVDKSKKAGMNAHLAKPIDPMQLYSTLYHYILDKSEDLL
ncbi:MAG: response regulator [Christensenella sp.]|nr:response regulator [Christensenella sp.]